MIVFPQVQAIINDSPKLMAVANSPLYPLIYIVQQFIHWLFMGYPLVAFCLFTYDKWLKVGEDLRHCLCLNPNDVTDIHALEYRELNCLWS